MTFYEALLERADKEKLSSAEIGKIIRAEANKHMGPQFVCVK